jgi:phytoene desaturase
MSQSKKNFIVVGAGLGGLATALRLAHRGHTVTILEKNGEIGGRNRPLKVNDCVFDSGPTLLMMLDPFRKLFADVGERFEDHLDISLCDPNYRVFFGDGTRINCTSNMARMIQEIDRVSGPEAAAAYPKMLGDFGALYHASVPQFVRRNYNSVLDLVDFRNLSVALKHGMLGNLAKSVAKYYSDPKLQSLFCLQTMYLGLSPYDAPAVYGVLVYMEYGEGIWYPKGGMVRICQAVAELAQKKGVKICLNTPVCKMDGKSVLLESGEKLEADAVICNADLPYAEKHLLAKNAKTEAAAKNRKYSCSAYMMYVDYEGDLPDLLHHNIVLGKDFQGNLDQIFNKFEMPEDPAFYVAISSKTDEAKAPEGHLNLFLLAPYPNLTRPFTEADDATIQDKVFSRLEKDFGFERSRIRGMKTKSPVDWNSELNLDLGAAFGLSHHLMQSVCFRPSNRDRNHKGLYYVGASTVPGNGLPMVLISAELVEKRLLEDGVIA